MSHVSPRAVYNLQTVSCLNPDNSPIAMDKNDIDHQPAILVRTVRVSQNIKELVQGPVRLLSMEGSLLL